MGGFNVFTGAAHLLASLPFSLMSPHPDTYSVGNVFLLFSVSDLYHARLKGEALI
jgi:hypothetical protein